MGARDGVPVGAGGGGLRRLGSVRPEAPDRHRRRRTRARTAASGGRSRCCARWSPPTTCCGASPAGRRPTPSLRSPATSGATCSAISPATRRATSPSACRARWPAASPRPSNAAFTTENTGSWNVLPPCVGVVCSIIFIGFVNLTMAGALVRRGGRAGRAGVLPRAPRHAAASQLCQQGGRGRWRTGRRDRQHGRGARVRRDVPRAAAHRRHDRRGDGRAPRQPDLSGAAAADPRRASPRR